MLLTPSFERSSPVQGALVLARYLVTQGEDVTLAALSGNRRGRASLLPEIEHARLNVRCFDMRGWAGLRHIARVRDFVRDRGIDVVISYSLRPEIVVSHLSGVVRVSAVREILRDQFMLSYGWAVARTLATLRLRVLKTLDGIFVLTHAMGDHLSENGIEPSVIHVVHNFVDVAGIRSVLSGDGHPKGPGVDIGYFGLLNRRKRVDVALRAVARLIHEYGHTQVRFHVAGEGPLHRGLRRLSHDLNVSEHTVFYGYLRRPFDLMKRMDCVLLTSDGEGLPRCLLEAMALGKTCIASDIPGMSELIRHGETGYLFRRGDVAGLAALLDEVIRGRRYIPEEELHRYMVAHYDMKSCGGEMLGRLHQMVGAPGRPDHAYPHLH